MRTPPRVPRRIWLVLGLFVATAGVGTFLWMDGASGVGWWLVNTWLRQRFSDVRTLSTAELSASLAAGQSEHRTVPRPLLVLDVREPEEYAVSHLPGARRFPPGADAAALTDWPKDAPVVTYCSVGYRSALVAQRLRAAGFTNVQNLRGSVFAWANEGRSLVNAGGQPTAVVHPYDSTWGLLVSPNHRAPSR